MSVLQANKALSHRVFTNKHIGSYFGPGFTFLAVTGEVIGLSQPDAAVVCRIEEVDVADECLDVQITKTVNGFNS